MLQLLIQVRLGGLDTVNWSMQGIHASSPSLDACISLARDARIERACPALDARMSSSVCFGLLFLQLVLCASMKNSCVCPMIGASLLLFICVEVQLCSKSNLSSARIGPGRFWSEATHLS